MQHLHGPVGFCECGRPVEFRQTVGAGPHREASCSCGRVHDLELGARGWSAVAQLTPERSVPLSGFSKELRQAPDAERYWFLFPLQGEVALPVHLVMSRSAKKAEVKAADLKVFTVERVSLPTDVRRRWIAWWRSHRPAHRSGRGSSFSPPRRIGRLPVGFLAARATSTTSP